MGVWPASAPQRGEDPLDLTTRCRCSEKRALLTPGSAGRDWPHRTQNALLDKDLIMGVMPSYQRYRGAISKSVAATEMLPPEP